jgi:predicted peroxiredoxin
MSRSLVVKVVAGADEAERCNQGFTVAANAVVSGVPVSLWLTGEATWLAVPGRAEEFALPHATPLSELLDTLREQARVTVCSQCAQRRSLSEADLLSNIGIRGAASFVEEIMRPEAQALVY